MRRSRSSRFALLWVLAALVCACVVVEPHPALERLLSVTSAQSAVAVDLSRETTSQTDAIAESAPSFETDIVPIFREYCWKCHGGRGHDGKLDLRTLPLILQGGRHGPAVVRGSTEESRLYRFVASRTMPPPYELQPTKAHLATIRRWIESGAAADYEGEPLSEEADPELTEDDRDWWSFRKPERPRVPAVDQSDRVRTPIDAFVLSELEQNGLRFSKDANRLTHIRRLYFDLLGLPPSPEEVDAFLADTSVDAYDHLVDRLLASPHYGERWGRHWLDAASYADTSDDDQQAERVQNRNGIWRYRDYVIQSLNSDLPYDRFLQEQIAGDEMVDWRSEPIDESTERLLIATGFLRHAPDVTDNEDRDVASSRHQVVYETVSMFGSNVLALTLQCAQCHTHKFDPVSHADYYRLVGLFKTAIDPQRWMRPAHRRIQPGKSDKGITIQALWDLGPPTTTYLHRGGNFETPGPVIEPGVIAVLDDPRNRFTLPTAPPPSGDSTGYRTALASWLTKPSHPLTARVIVNRVWQHLFGVGIVATAGNFGVAGSGPTHPELLDWLSVEFVSHGWSFKHLHKLILSSTVYRQTSRTGSKEELVAEYGVDPNQIDADNNLLWRMRLRRLESEVVRDSMLAASGVLDTRPGGPPIPVRANIDGSVELDMEQPAARRGRNRRSIYLFSRRNYPLTELSVFDQPTGNTNCVQRTKSAVVSQALLTLNSAFVLTQAQHLANRVKAVSRSDSEHQIEQAFRFALSRRPTPHEIEVGQRFLELQTTAYRQQKDATDATSADAALISLCHMLLNTNEFLYVE